MCNFTEAINLPSQSILEEKQDFVNARNLTLKDLLGQLKHYNAHVRKGESGVSGLIEWCRCACGYQRFGTASSSSVSTSLGSHTREFTGTTHRRTAISKDCTPLLALPPIGVEQGRYLSTVPNFTLFRRASYPLGPS